MFNYACPCHGDGGPLSQKTPPFVHSALMKYFSNYMRFYCYCKSGLSTHPTKFNSSFILNHFLAIFLVIVNHTMWTREDHHHYLARVFVNTNFTHRVILRPRHLHLQVFFFLVNGWRNIFFSFLAANSVRTACTVCIPFFFVFVHLNYSTLITFPMPATTGRSYKSSPFGMLIWYGTENFY